ncbi:ABC transporter permease [Gordonia malaquae]|uniref:ABC transporter permease n=2 Tax=Gordonia TaxID=2053 RepID=UPI0030FEC917
MTVDPKTATSAPPQLSPSSIRRLRSYVIETVSSSTRTTGRALKLFAESAAYVVGDIVTGRFHWAECLKQMLFIIRVTALPAILVSIPFGVIVSVQVSSLTQQVGASSMAGAAGGLGVIRQGSPMVSALLLGGAAGSAIAADLGARTIREELDAMRTMGIDPSRNLVAPRLLAMMLIAPMLCVLIIFMGIGVGYVITVSFQDGVPGSYMASFAAFATVTDLVIALVKALIFGLVIVVVACQRGMEASSGPRGVASAVNAAVVIGVIAAFVLNVIITQSVAMFFPARIG